MLQQNANMRIPTGLTCISESNTEHMKFEHLEYDDCMMDVSIFSPADGKKELHAILHPKAELSFEQQYMAVRKALSEYILQNTGFVPVFMRWFLSDSANQQKIVEGNDYPCAGSIIEQPPGYGWRKMHPSGRRKAGCGLQILEEQGISGLQKNAGPRALQSSR